MTEGLYLRDAYLREFTASVVDVRPDGIVLDRTAFYPGGGGQPGDRGTLSTSAGTRATVLEVAKGSEGILHRIDSAEVRIGETVRGEIDWPLRYAHMRYHTALHILSGAVYRSFGSGITGGQIYADRARMDFSLPEFDRVTSQRLLDDVNAVVVAARPVNVRFVPRAEFDADPSLVRVDRSLLPSGDPVRLIDIVGYDVQADGGTHVMSTAEVGRVELDRIENKGARNKRLYVRATAPPSTAPPR